MSHLAETIMFPSLRLDRPLVVLDLETTGIEPATARIVEIAVLKVAPDGTREARCRRLNPGEPIPADATAIHGITDQDVANEPTFRQIANSLRDYLHGCDLCGFNLSRYDLRVLHHEFQRARVPFDLSGRAVVDLFTLYCHLHPRNLSAAVRAYLGQDHETAHSASGDTAATLEVLHAMLARHPELPRSPLELEAIVRDPNALDSDGFFARVGDGIRFKRGKYRSQPLKYVAETAPDYLRWMLGQEFREDTLAVVRLALNEQNRVKEILTPNA